MGVSVFDGYFWKCCALTWRPEFSGTENMALFVVLGIAKREKMCYKEGYVSFYRNPG